MRNHTEHKSLTNVDDGQPPSTMVNHGQPSSGKRIEKKIIENIRRENNKNRLNQGVDETSTTTKGCKPVTIAACSDQPDYDMLVDDLMNEFALSEFDFSSEVKNVRGWLYHLLKTDGYLYSEILDAAAMAILYETDMKGKPIKSKVGYMMEALHHKRDGWTKEEARKLYQ